MITYGNSPLIYCGSKQRIVNKILNYFPPHKTYIELFLGAGGLYFNKPLSRYNFVNDIDDDIFNLFMVIKDKPVELHNAFNELVVSESLYKYWKDNNETDDIMKAVRFVFLCNWGYLGKPNTLKITQNNVKSIFLSKIDIVNRLLEDTVILHCDFRKVLNKVSLRDKENGKKTAFIYADPPYLSTASPLNRDFTEQDTRTLFKMLVESEIRFAISEFANPVILELAKKYSLRVIEIGERCNLKNRRAEILIINYDISEELFIL